ncbi:MAG TPA: FAD-dependent oxidoreductase [Pseudobdellovibrionaceae bacterium]|nr:FAD-dependent oxidoreductase [Pseudobdellovibrionaceae bacterium]
MPTTQFDLIVIGGGASGIAATWILGQWRPSTRVLLLEKSHGWGGRMATRRHQEWVFDHGALRIESFGDYNRDLWALGEFNLPDSSSDSTLPTRQFSHPHTASRGMTAWAKRALAQFSPQTNTRLEAQVVKVDRHDSQWTVTLNSGEEFTSTHLLITAPAPQARDLLGFSANSPTTWESAPTEWRERLLADPRLKSPPVYAPCVTALAGFRGDAASLRQAWAALSSQWPDVMSWRWNDEHGPSTQPALSLQMNEAWSRAHTLDEGAKPLAPSPQATTLILQNLKQAGLEPDFFDLKVWRYAYPVGDGSAAASEAARSPSLNLGQKLWLAGDAWAGVGVRAAVFSGFMAARQIAEDLA